MIPPKLESELKMRIWDSASNRFAGWEHKWICISNGLITWFANEYSINPNGAAKIIGDCQLTGMKLKESGNFVLSFGIETILGMSTLEVAAPKEDYRLWQFVINRHAQFASEEDVLNGLLLSDDGDYSLDTEIEKLAAMSKSHFELNVLGNIYSIGVSPLDDVDELTEHIVSEHRMRPQMKTRIETELLRTQLESCRNYHGVLFGLIARIQRRFGDVVLAEGRAAAAEHHANVLSSQLSNIESMIPQLSQAVESIDGVQKLLESVQTLSARLEEEKRHSESIRKDLDQERNIRSNLEASLREISTRLHIAEQTNDELQNENSALKIDIAVVSKRNIELQKQQQQQHQLVLLQQQGMNVSSNHDHDGIGPGPPRGQGVSSPWFQRSVSPHRGAHPQSHAANQISQNQALLPYRDKNAHSLWSLPPPPQPTPPRSPSPVSAHTHARDRYGSSPTSSMRRNALSTGRPVSPGRHLTVGVYDVEGRDDISSHTTSTPVNRPSKSGNGVYARYGSPVVDAMSLGPTVVHPSYYAGLESRSGDEDEPRLHSALQEPPSKSTERSVGSGLGDIRGKEIDHEALRSRDNEPGCLAVRDIHDQQNSSRRGRASPRHSSDSANTFSDVIAHVHVQDGHRDEKESLSAHAAVNDGRTGRRSIRFDVDE